MHQARAGHEIRPQRVLEPMPRKGDDHVAGQRRHAAAQQQILIAFLKKPRGAAEICLEPEHLADQHTGHTDQSMRPRDRHLVINERRRGPTPP